MSSQIINQIPARANTIIATLIALSIVSSFHLTAVIFFLVKCVM
jgi:hypothetical protein